MVDERAWRPSGVVTLTTDFGLREPHVGIVKGVVLSRLPSATLVDLTHAVPPRDVRAGGWYLAGSWRWFPPGSVHVAVVDPGVGSRRRILVAQAQGHAFLAPDNGLLGPVLPPEARVWALDVERFAMPRTSATFHGRDVFAPAAAAIAGGLAPADAGQPAGPWQSVSFPDPVRRADGAIETEVLLVDHFGNLVSGLVPGPAEGDLCDWEVEIGGRRVATARTYAEVEPGELCALVDSWGHLEVARRDGDAAATLGLGPGAPLTLWRRT